MARELSRRARGTWWLGLLVWCGALGCQGPGSNEAADRTPQEQATTNGGTGSERVRAATKRPDAGTADAGQFRLELEGVPRREAGERGACPEGLHRCCNGSCSPDKRCPGVSCDPVPTMPE
jgi:hypothetical protein